MGPEGTVTSVSTGGRSVSVQYPETTPTVLRTVCRVPGQIDVLKTFQGKWGQFSWLRGLTFTGHSHYTLTSRS